MSKFLITNLADYKVFTIHGAYCEYLSLNCILNNLSISFKVKFTFVIFNGNEYSFLAG